MEHNLMPYAELLQELEERDRMLGEAVELLRRNREQVSLLYPNGTVTLVHADTKDFLAAYDASKTAGKDGA